MQESLQPPCCLLIRTSTLHAAQAIFFLLCDLFTCEYANTPANAMPVPA